MSETCQIEIRLRVESLDVPTEAEIDLLASVLPELILLMQQQADAED